MAVTDPDREQHRSIGAYLQETRVSQGKTLEDAAGVTRIGKNYLLAIEGDQYDKLPGPSYLKGFLRIYATYLGLSGDTIISLYEQSHAPAAIRSPESGAPPLPGKDRESREGRRLWLVPVVLLVLILALASLTGKRDDSPAPPSPPGQGKPAAALTPLLPQRTSATPGRAGSPARVERDLQPETGDAPPLGIVLRLKVNQDSSLNITIDDTISQPYDLKSGDIIEWKAERIFSLDVGNAGGIEAEFNGKQLPPLGESGKSAHIVLKGDGRQ